MTTPLRKDCTSYTIWEIVLTLPSTVAKKCMPPVMKNLEEQPIMPVLSWGGGFVLPQQYNIVIRETIKYDICISNQPIDA
jgi:hypothetical protein